MRLALAAISDAAIVGGLSYAAFRLAFAATPCRETSSCLPLAPAVVIAVLLVVVLYFAVSLRVFHATPGQRIFRAEERNI